jgi:EAL and modified HD-GYP domain-containing signal transduction protein
VFDLPPRDPRDRSAAPELIGQWVHGWSPVVGRDLRPLGVRVLMRRRFSPATAAEAAVPPMAALLDAVLQGFVVEGGAAFPHGLVVLAPQDLGFDVSMLAWRAPRNVVLELSPAVLSDEAVMRHVFEVHRHGIKLALRLAPTDAVPDATRLAVFQYVVLEAKQLASTKARNCLGDALVLAVDGDSHAEASAAIGAGAHAVVGWSLVAPESMRGRPLAPTQRAVLELIRLVQADADLDDLEEAFKGEPLLAYMLLTLANSPAFVRATPIASLRHAITLLGYRRLVKWLVLLMVVASKDMGALPQIYSAVARGFLMENLAAAAGAPAATQDEGFVVGAFSLLGAITGQSLPELLEQVNLPESVRSALLHREGQNGTLLDLATTLERARDAHNDEALLNAARAANLDLAAINGALLQALAATDALVSVV